MQIMFDAGDEHGVRTEGLGEWPGVVDRLTAPVVPHMGWSTIDAPADSALFRGIGDQRFYFVHSYAARSFAPLGGGRFTEPVVTWSEHGERFVAAVENRPLCATQFHPEKSGDAGLLGVELGGAQRPVLHGGDEPLAVLGPGHDGFGEPPATE